MRAFVVILAVVACASAGNVNRGKRSGWGEYSLGSSGWAAPAYAAAAPVLSYAAPAAQVVTVNKVVNTQRVVDVPQVVSVRKLVNEPRVVSVNKLVAAPSYSAPLYSAGLGYGSSLGYDSIGCGSGYGCGSRIAATNNGWW